MIFGQYHFNCRFQNEAILPAYKGSTFRGVFGHALRKVTCALKKQDCVHCLLRNTCVYAFFFGSRQIDVQQKAKAKVVKPPNPYVIEPPLASKAEYMPDEEFDFTVLLFGEANRYLPYVVYALKYMGDSGIGKRINGKRARFELNEVMVEEKVIFSAETEILDSVKAENINFESLTYSQQPIREVTLYFNTPLRLKFRNRLSAELPFHVLIRTVLRRVSALEEYYGCGEPSLDYRTLVSKAENVRETSSDLKWVDWRRYSNRQETSMFLGGLIGSVTYRGDLSEYMGLLKYAEKVHLGKQTSFGLGKFNILIPD